MAFPLIGAIALGIGAIKGIGQGIQARNLEKNLVRPEAEVNQNLVTNVTQAEQMANVGIPQEQYMQAIQNIQRNQNAGFRQVSQRAGIGSIASLMRTSNDATNNLAVTDANARQQNQRLAMQNRGILAQEENRVWDVNEMQPYLQQLQRIQALRGAGQQNTFGALGAAAQIGMSSGGLGNVLGGGQPQQNPLSINPTVQTMGVTSGQPLGLPIGGFQRTL